jgi:hypothetical protein
MARRILIILIVIAFLFGMILLGVGIARAQTTAPDFKAIDSAIDAYLPKFVDYELTYIASHDNYYQALWSHTDTPVDGALVSPDLLVSKPTDQAEPLSAVWDAVKVTSDEQTPMRFRIDVYSGPRGKGFVVTFEVMFEGVVYARSTNVGDETYREQSWQEVKPDVEAAK